MLNRMKKTYYVLIVLLTTALSAFTPEKSATDNRILSYTVNPKTQELKFYWKDEKGDIYKSILNLKNQFAGKHKTLVFAMNGGMYMQNNAPLGRYIEENKRLSALNQATGTGNFYLKPNGVFYIAFDKHAVICKSNDFKENKNIAFATQSGPMLVIDGKIHAEFKEGSKNLNIRNGVGILPDGKIVFALSKEEINFYVFAKYFN